VETQPANDGSDSLSKSNAGSSQPEPAESAAPSLFEATRCSLSLAEREDRLSDIAARVARCTRCQELAQSRTQTVFGVGNPQAEIMFLGEAPGADEDRLGEPFVGAAGQLLNRILEASRLKRSDVYICNILRCRPPGNRNPLPDEAANCREYLDAQIEVVDPDYIVCLGSVAAKNLLGVADSIGKLRGRILHYGRAKVVCTYHPAYLLRNPAAKKEVWEDMKLLMRDRGVDLSAK
jgi:DNA polymerase